MIIPVGINASHGTQITISAQALNLPNGIDVYLEDKQDSSFRLLSDTSNFTTTLSSNLNGIGRFFIHTSSSLLSNDNVTLDNVSIYTTDNTLRIVGVQRGNTSVSLYSILGKQLLKTSFQANGLNDIKLPNLKTGIYIVQIESEDRKKLNKKVIIQ